MIGVTNGDGASSSRRLGERLSQWLPRLFRLLLLVAAAGIVAAAAFAPKPPDEIPFSVAKTFFPTADRFAAGDPRLGGQSVVDKFGRTLGLLLTTSPHADRLVGYAGPNNLLIALDPQQHVIGVKLLSSGDTQSHVEQVEQQTSFWQQFIGSGPAQRPAQIEAVSGSTLTSMAMAEAIELRLRGSSLSLRFPEPVTLVEIQKLFPAAASFQTDQPRGGWHHVLDAAGKHLGFAVRTSPFSDNGHGYRGPTETLIAVAADGQTVKGLLIRKSYDTEEYVERVREDDGFLKLLADRSIAEWADIDFAKAGIEGVSGATQTSFAVAEGMRRRFAADAAARQAAVEATNYNPVLLVIIVGGLLMTFTSLKNSRRMRWIWQGILVVAFLFWIGDLLSIALLVGWARHGIPWRTAPVVVLLAAVALVIPWTTRRQIYCDQLCPHGAAQTWLARFKQLHLRVNPTVDRWLSRIPAALLVVALVLATFALRFDLAQLEPFDGWVLKSAAIVSATLAVVGLIASLFVPQAYCRYGCPTGELLQLVKSGGSGDRLTRRDWLTAAVLAIVGGVVLFPRFNDAIARRGAESKQATGPSVRADNRLQGTAFGTTWSVKVRGTHDFAALQTAAATEIERIEKTLSHWHSDSATAQFNASETTFETEQPKELLQLVAKALEVHRATAGKYDITVAPLVAAWGFGPGQPRANPPTDDELAALLPRVGSDKLIVDLEAQTLRKKHPQLQIDLGSLLQGYAADQVAKLLLAAGVNEFLIDVGGELLAHGEWTVAIENPQNPSLPLRTLTLRNQALATSGTYRTQKKSESSPTHHLISPLTGRPFPAATLCAVLAPTACAADLWSTALMAVGLPESLAVADQQQLPILVLDPDNQIHVNQAGKEIFGHDR